MSKLGFPIVEGVREMILADSMGEQPFFDALRAHGVSFEFVDWSKPELWSGFDALSVKYLWGYHMMRSAFSQFLEQLGDLRVINSTEVIRWNADKTYLQDLAQRGSTVAELHIVPQGQAVDLEQLLRSKGWQDFIIKPTFSAGSKDTYRGSIDDIAQLQPKAERISENSALIVQPFFEEIVRDGELTLLMFGGEFGHAVLRQAKAGDFRAHPMFGGAYSAVDPPAEVLRQCRETLERLPVMPTYARLDGFMRNGQFLLTELELLDPMFFLNAAPKRSTELAAAAFASACR